MDGFVSFLKERFYVPKSLSFGFLFSPVLILFFFLIFFLNKFALFLQLNLNNVRRCVLFNYNSASDEIDFRHYAIKVTPVNISKGVKKMIQNKVPDLSKYSNPAEFILK